MNFAFLNNYFCLIEETTLELEQCINIPFSWKEFSFHIQMSSIFFATMSSALIPMNKLPGPGRMGRDVVKLKSRIAFPWCKGLLGERDAARCRWSRALSSPPRSLQWESYLRTWREKEQYKFTPKLEVCLCLSSLLLQFKFLRTWQSFANKQGICSWWSEFSINLRKGRIKINSSERTIWALHKHYDIEEDNTIMLFILIPFYLSNFSFLF